MNLQEELSKAVEGFKSKAPEEVKEQMQKATEELEKNQILSQAKRTGDKFPNFELNNQNFAPKSLKEYFNENKFLIISFYRGGWCPYCNLELKALESNLRDFKALGAHLIAITPETPDNSLNTSEKNLLSFDVLSDNESVLSKELGISFELPENLKPIYNNFGIDIPAHNGKNNFTLPVPATYIIDQEGNIFYDFLDIDYTKRSNPDIIIEKLKQLNN